MAKKGFLGRSKIMPNGGTIVVSVTEQSNNWGYTFGKECTYSFKFKCADGNVSEFFKISYVGMLFGFHVDLLSGFAQLLGSFESSLLHTFFAKNPLLEIKKDSFDFIYREHLSPESKAAPVEKTLLLLFGVDTLSQTVAGAKSDMNAAKRFAKTLDSCGSSGVRDLEVLLHPTFSRFGSEDYDFLKFANNCGFKLNRLASKDAREVVKRMITVLINNPPEDQLLRNIPIADTDEMFAATETPFLRIEKFPLRQQAFREYLLGLTVWEILALLSWTGNVLRPHFTSEEGIEVCRFYFVKLKESSPKIHAVPIIAETYALASQLLDPLIGETDNIEPLDKIHEMMKGSIKKKHLLLAVRNHLATHNPNSLTVESLLEECSIILSPQKKWVTQTHLADFTMQKLTQVAGTRAARHVIDVAQSGNPLTSEQWTQVIDRYVDVKNVPVAWWTDML